MRTCVLQDRANVSDEDSASFFWQDCCSANEATDVELEQTSPSGAFQTALQSCSHPSCVCARMVCPNAAFAVHQCLPRCQRRNAAWQCGSCGSSSEECQTGRGSAELPNSWPSSSRAYAIRGRICASKGRQANEAANIVQVLLEVIRLPHVGSDVVITLNTPMVVSERSAAAQDTGAGPKTLHHAAPELFRRMTASFAIHDWSLFGGD